MSGFDREILYCDGADIGPDAKDTSSATRICSIRKDQDATTNSNVVNDSTGTSANAQSKVTSNDSGGGIAAYPSTHSVSFLAKKFVLNADSDCDDLLVRSQGSQSIEFYNDSTKIGEADATGQWAFPVKPLKEISGGTGTATYTTGDVLYASATNTLSKLPIGTNGQSLVLTNGVPAWTSQSVGGEIGVSNLGISYSSPTFTIHGADGTALSSTNPAYVTMSSKANPGQLISIAITANQSFDDDSGTSDIAGNLFGFTTGVAITVDVPFFIYAVMNDAEDTIQFMISRVPGCGISPPAADIGAPDDAVADEQNDFWSLSNIDETLYESNPCLCIGGFRMQMSASDDWTVQAISNGDVTGPDDGIGKYFVGHPFEIPLGQFGADSGTLCRANAGTCPVFTDINQNSYTFVAYNSPYIFIAVDIDNDGGTDGAGAVSAQIITPFILSTQEGTGTLVNTSGFVQHPTATECIMNIPSTTINFTDLRFVTSPLTAIQWGAFTNGDRRIFFNMFSRIRIDL